MYHDLFHSIDDLKGSVAKLEKKSKGWKHRFWGAALAAILVTGTAVAITATVTTYYGATGDVIAYDTSVFTMTTQGHLLAGSTVAAAGTTNSLVGASAMAVSNGGAANTALTQGHWVFQATLTEAGVASFTSATAYYKAELFVDGTSQGSLYVKNTAGTAITTEGIVLKWGIGASISGTSAYLIKVSQMAA